MAVSGVPAALARVRVIMLDATGTLIYHKDDIAKAYCRSAAQASRQAPPTVEAMRKSFKAAFKSSLQRYPCFGHAEGLSTRAWWKHTVQEAFLGAGAKYSSAEFDRVFRCVYQHFGSPEGYRIFEDVLPFLQWAKSQGYGIGLVTNNMDRLVDSTLPMFGLHSYLNFYALSQEVGFEKPSREIFVHACQEASATVGSDITPSEVVHIGDNYAADYCGARAAGMSAFLIQRQGVSQYQDWLQGPDFEGKSDEEVQCVTSLSDVRDRLEEAKKCVGC